MGTISCVAQEAQDRGARDTFDSVGTEVVALEVIADLLRDTQLDLADIADIETGDCLPGVSTGESSSDDNGLVWVKIPAGCFQMGCSAGDEACLGDEKPAHRAQISAFELLETEVTEAQYEAVMASNPSCRYNDTGGSEFPVECVAWIEAKTFCETVGGRLPTEAEWEYSLRAGTTSVFSCGEDQSCVGEVAWYFGNSGGQKHPVKTKRANEYAVYDMLGNVQEWTNDWYDEYYYSTGPAGDPPGPDSGALRVMRGGSFGDDLNRVFCASFRFPEDPAKATGRIGIRCARDLP
jgi:formylglycine-generating enzyme required for sulfatase activity